MQLDLTSDAHRQLSLMDAPQNEAERARRRRLMATVNRLKRELGRDAICLGLPRQGNNWELRYGKRTLRYTTRWDELLRGKS